MARYLYSAMASALDAWKNNCAILNGDKSGDVDNAREWEDKWDGLLCMMEKELLPSGSGFDNGTKLDRERSHAEKLVLTTAFHHMDEGGGYAGWTEHEVIVTPGFNGIRLRITGRNRNDIKEYISQAFYEALTRDIEYEWLLQMLPGEKRVEAKRCKRTGDGDPIWAVRDELFVSLEAAKSRAVAIMLEAQRNG
jgi:hypothetical protein